jgi:hypothetical protein
MRRYRRSFGRDRRRKMALTNYEFAQLTARVAQRGANWTRD